MKTPKEFWSKIKKMFPVKAKSANATSFKINSIPTTDKQKISNAFCSYFTSI